MRSWPATSTLPADARSRPATTIRSDVLPEPDGPTTASDWPFVDAQIDVAQHLDRAGAARQGQLHILKRDDRLAHGVAFHAL